MTGKLTIGWVLLLLFVLPSFASAQEVLPINYFTRSDELGTMKLSPDGTFIALTSGQHGAELLTFYDLGQRKAVASVQAPDGLEIDEFHWASNTRVIFLIAERQPGNVHPTPTGEIFAVDRDGGRQFRIYGYRAGQQSTGTHIKGRDASFASPSIVSFLDKDDRNILIAEMPWKLMGDTWRYNPDAKPQLTRLDIYTGRESRMGRVPLASATVIVDRDDQPRFAVGMDDNHALAVAWKREPSAEWEEFVLPGFQESTVIPHRFTSDNRAVLFTGVPEGERYASLFELELADRSIKKLISIPETDVQDVITDFEDRETIGVLGYTDKLVHEWLVPSHPAAKLRQALHKAFAGNEVSFISQSDDGKRAIVFVQSDVAPGEFLLFDTQTKQAEMLKAARSWVDLNKMRPKEPIKLTARDGVPLHGYVTRPVGPGPHPLVVLPHGGPHGIRDEWSFDWEAQLLASRGYAVLQVNYRGSGGYGIDFEELGFKEWGARMQDDVTDATRWAIDQKIAASDRICIYGWSYGGYAALMGVAREPELYRCAIGAAGVYDLEFMFQSGDIPDSKIGLDYLNHVLGTDAADLRARSPVNLTEKIKVPVLLIHGKSDGRVDYEQSKRMKAALEKHNMPVEWLALRGEGHGIYDDETRLEVYTGILKFLATHLSARPVAGQ